MRKSTKAIIAFLALVGLCAVCLWLAPYIEYFSMVELIGHGTQGRMHCWVRVVDQNGKGVEGYKCRVVEEHASWWPFSEGKDVVRIFTTDKRGYFEYKSRGATGRVFFGYPCNMEWTLNPQHLLDESNLRVPALKLREAKETNPHGYLGSAGNPYELHVFSVGPPQRLLYWDKPARLKNKHDWVCVDILSGHLWESKTAGGDIAVRDNRFTPENIKGYCLQSFLAGPQCSIYPVVDDWGLRPPLKGYRKELCSSRDWLALRKQTYNQTEIYYRLAVKGRYIYGRLLLFGSGRASDSLYVCYTNLQGRQDLYFKGYESSVMHPGVWKMQDYVKPPVSPKDLFRNNPSPPQPPGNGTTASGPN